MQKSAHFRVRWCFNLYPLHYRMAFAFSTFLCPHFIRLSLRFAYLLLYRRNTGLPCFLYMTNEWVRIRLSAGSRYVRVTLAWRRLSDCVPFGLEPSIVGSSFEVTTFINDSHYVIHTIQPSSPAIRYWRQLSSPHSSDFSFRKGFIVGSVTARIHYLISHVPIGYCWRNNRFNHSISNPWNGTLNNHTQDLHVTAKLPRWG